MVVVWLIGIVIIGIDLYILYHLRDFGKKVLKVWMIVLGIILAIIPLCGLVFGIVGFISIPVAKDVYVLKFDREFKLVKWLNKEV